MSAARSTPPTAAAPPAAARPAADHLPRRALLLGGTAILLTLALLAVAVVSARPADAPLWGWGELASRTEAGAAALGSSTAPVPPGALVVAADAPPGGDGSISRPFATVADALARVKGRGEIVLRGGEYHEEVFIGRSKTVTIGPYPGETVWFDGTEAFANWTGSAGAWRAPWPYSFSSAPSYTGGEDGDVPTWQFIDPEYPFAAHPEQLWFDGEPVRQVAPDEVVAGTFAVDPDRAELILGDDPEGHEVRVATLQRAFQVRSPDSVVQGIGVRRYAPSVPSMGAVVLEGDRALLRDVVIEDASTSGLFVTGTDSTVRDVTIRRSGMIGATANYADALTLDGVRFEGNNTEHFNQAPVSGGFKISRSRHLVIENSVFRDNRGPGIWLDQSVFDTTIASSDILANAGHGVFAEISEKVLMTDLVVVGNRRIGVKINNTGDVQLWRSTIVGNGLALAMLQDVRRGDDPAVPGHDDRRPMPDPDMPWTVAGTVIADNVIGAVAGSTRDSGDQPTTPLWMRDYSGAFSTADMVASVSGNIIHRERPADQPIAVWQNAKGATVVTSSLEEWQTEFPQAAGNAELQGAAPVDDGFRLTASASAAAVTATPPPAEVGAVLGDAVDGPPGAVVPQPAEGSGSGEPAAVPGSARTSGTSTSRRIASPPRRAPAARSRGTQWGSPPASSSTSTAPAEARLSSTRSRKT